MFKDRVRDNKKVSENDRYILYRPNHSWDANYHLKDKESGKEHLISIDEVVSDEEYSMLSNDDRDYFMSWERLASLEEMELIFNFVWKTI